MFETYLLIRLFVLFYYFFLLGGIDPDKSLVRLNKQHIIERERSLNTLPFLLSSGEEDLYDALPIEPSFSPLFSLLLSFYPSVVCAPGAFQLVPPSTAMAAAEHAITINNERPMEIEIPILPPNQGFEAFKDIVCGSVSHEVEFHGIMAFTDSFHR